MKYTKILAPAIGALIAVGSMFMSGCHDETKNLDKCLNFAKSAGMTAGYVINTSAGTLGPEVKDTIAAVTKAIVTELPTNVTVETIAVDLKTISTNAVYTALPEICEKYPQLVDETVGTLLDFLQTGLTSVSEKYPTEFGNAKMFYQIAYTFFDSVNTVIEMFNKDVATAVKAEQALVILPVDYEVILMAAKIDGVDKKFILGKADFEALMTTFKK